jgi:hypothetical protein
VDVVFHFSEDPTITEFVPHVAATAADPRPLVWAVDGSRSPDYWFPRDCPRAMAWVEESTTEDDRRRILGPGAHGRVHAVEYGWLTRLATGRLFRYQLPAEPFRPVDEVSRCALVSEEAVRPLGPPDPLPPLLELHERARIQLRVMDTLWPWWQEVTASTLGFSGIRLANARPH